MKDIKLWHYVKGSPNPYTTHAWVGVEATGVTAFEGERADCKPTEGNVGGEGPFSAEQWIKSLKADRIRLFVFSGDLQRNTVESEIVIRWGSLTDYYGAAYGGEAEWLDVEHGGFSQQLLGAATGEIVLSHKAYNRERETNPNVLGKTEIVGDLAGYSARAQVARFGGDLVEAELNYEALQATGKIEHSHEARSRDGDWAACELNISNGKLISLGDPCFSKIDGKDWSHTEASMRAEVDPMFATADYRTSYRNPDIRTPIATFNKIPGREVILCRARQP